MAVELAEIAAGLPVAASFAMATGITAFREGRRRSSLNEAIHELRRPLQALALSLPGDSRRAEAIGSSLRMAAAAVDRLDREVNGGLAEAVPEPVALRPIVESAVGRWRLRAAAEGRPLRLRWSAGAVELRGSAAELTQAVDNLISNALEHGGGEIAVEVCQEGDLVNVEVGDGGVSAKASKPRRLRGRARGARRRHGHGLRIVRRVAARHGGSFRLHRSPHGTTARLALPLAGGSR
ncbi:MAG TPA: HAMP domain-containing sensor histidine kinase [Solirubrobacterales bacterium]|jgi:signal transduction histidine kinase|nr:HAMP domain-containing sensor histidine kinase [Solirubrobacterales bacterium]